MNDKELALIEKLAHVLGNNATAVVDHCVVWFLVSASFWVLAGSALIAIAVCLYPKTKRCNEDDHAPFIAIIALLTVLGFFLIGINIADLVAPRAMAIHRLLNDITP